MSARDFFFVQSRSQQRHRSMGLLLIPLLVGILLSPCLDSGSVWIAIPATIATLTLPSPRGRGWGLHLLIALVGAADAARIPAVPPVPEDSALRLLEKLTKAPECRARGSY